MKVLERFDIKGLTEPTLPKVVRKVTGTISTDFLPKLEHINTESVEEAVLMLKAYEGQAAVIAGGQDLLRQLKARVRPTQPSVLINIKTIRPKLDYIEESAVGLSIGGLTTLRSIETSEVVRGKYSLLAQATHATRAVQYRNMATIGGDLCQQARCWYYRASGNAFFCRRKGGDKCYALKGDNRYHSIFAGRACIATCPSDTAIALVALGASVKIVGVSGERTVPVEEFYTSLGNILQLDEIVTELHIPVSDTDSKGTYMKFGLGNVFGPTIVSLALVTRLQNKLCMGASLIIGAVSPVPWRCAKAEKMLIGEKINKDIAESVAQAAVEGTTLLSWNGYKVDIVRTMVKRAIMEMG